LGGGARTIGAMLGRRLWISVLVGGLALAAAPAEAWTPKTQVTIAWEAARLAPRDLYRQI